MKHHLDDQVEDILQHYGIRGMRWGVRRSDAEIKEDIKNSVDALGEAIEDADDEVMGNDSITEELTDVLDIVFGGEGNLEKETKQLTDAVKDKVEDIGKEVKERGSRILTRIFGESKNRRRTLMFDRNGKAKWVEEPLD